MIACGHKSCGKKVQKSLSTRTHVCPHCGTDLDSDHNAAINILKKGLSTVGHTGSEACDGVIPSTLVDSTNGGDLPSSLVGEILLGYGESVNQES